MWLNLMTHPGRLLRTVAVASAIYLVGAARATAQQPAPGATPTPTPVAGATPPGATPTPSPSPTPIPPGPRYLGTYEPCHEAVLGIESKLDATRRLLYQTLCGASLWLDGLFGRHASVAGAEAVNGRAELSVLHSNVQGTKVKTGLDVNVTLPHLERRLNAFVGRSDPTDYIHDRQEGFGLRSEFVSLESEEKWLGGLGYSLPGAVGQRFSLRAGVAGGINAKVFGQAIYRQNVSIGEADLVHVREVGFWEGRGAGFGFTSSADVDHVVSETMLLRWGSIGTVSQGVHGLDWRSALVLYQNLRHSHAMAYEAFMRGVTSTLGLTEYGGRVIYRQSVYRPWFFLDALTGYSWIRLNPGDPHKGSVLVGLGAEMWYGPYQ